MTIVEVEYGTISSVAASPARSSTLTRLLRRIFCGFPASTNSDVLTQPTDSQTFCLTLNATWHAYPSLPHESRRALEDAFVSRDRVKFARGTAVPY